MPWVGVQSLIVAWPGQSQFLFSGKRYFFKIYSEAKQVVVGKCSVNSLQFSHICIQFDMLSLKIFIANFKTRFSK